MRKQGRIPSFLLLLSEFHTKENVLKSVTCTQLTTTDSESNFRPNIHFHILFDNSDLHVWVAFLRQLSVAIASKSTCYCTNTQQEHSRSQAYTLIWFILIHYDSRKEYILQRYKCPLISLLLVVISLHAYILFIFKYVQILRAEYALKRCIYVKLFTFWQTLSNKKHILPFVTENNIPTRWITVCESREILGICLR